MFKDYMASVEKQLLGTETVQRMRARGVTARICGLSANDMQNAFLEAGANAFLLKPLPCKADSLLQALEYVWESDSDKDSSRVAEVTESTEGGPSSQSTSSESDSIRETSSTRSYEMERIVI